MLIVYEVELTVGTTTVGVTAGGTTTANIASTLSVRITSQTAFQANISFSFRRQQSGLSVTTTALLAASSTPSGYFYQKVEYTADPHDSKIETMHPSDTRMSSWGPVTFTIGSAATAFPMAIFQAIGPVVIKTTLTSSQSASPYLPFRLKVSC